MRLGYLLDFGEALLHKSGWMLIGIVSSAVSVAIPYYESVWFSIGEYSATGLEVAWTLATLLTLFAIFKVYLACYEHILGIRIKMRQLK